MYGEQGVQGRAGSALQRRECKIEQGVHSRGGVQDSEGSERAGNVQGVQGRAGSAKQSRECKVEQGMYREQGLQGRVGNARQNREWNIEMGVQDREGVHRKRESKTE